MSAPIQIALLFSSVDGSSEKPEYMSILLYPFFLNAFAIFEAVGTSANLIRTLFSEFAFWGAFVLDIATKHVPSVFFVLDCLLSTISILRF